MADAGFDDPHRVASLAALREAIPAPNEATQRKLLPRLDDHAKAFVARSPLAFVATADDAGQPDVSPKGDKPGFVRVCGDATLWLPERPGNRLAMGFQNILQTGRIALIFVIPGVSESLRVRGRATLTRDPAVLEALAAGGKPALLCTVVAVESCFFHCGKAFIRSAAWQAHDPAAGAAASDLMVRQFSAGLGLTEAAYREKLHENYRTDLW